MYNIETIKCVVRGITKGEVIVHGVPSQGIVEFEVHSENEKDKPCSFELTFDNAVALAKILETLTSED